MLTHDLRLAQRVADRAAFLENGRILEEGTAADFFENPRADALRRFLASPEDTHE
jgi:ABC-type polar amino acid transport system ATPase subunit